VIENDGSVHGVKSQEYSTDACGVDIWRTTFHVQYLATLRPRISVSVYAVAAANPPSLSVHTVVVIS
jgi:hypothetical protein